MQSFGIIRDDHQRERCSDESVRMRASLDDGNNWPFANYIYLHLPEW
jgi:hypothetical protein